MIQYILILKKFKDTKAIIFCTSAGVMGQSLSYAKFLLSKKGVQVIHTEMIQYTYNWKQILSPII